MQKKISLPLILCLSLFALVFVKPVQSVENSSQGPVEMDEKLGNQIPLDTLFSDEEGNEVTLKKLLKGKPAVLSLVYYSCPGICSPLLEGFRDVIEKSSEVPGIDYHALTLSFDPSEGPQLAQEKKGNYLKSLKKNGNPEGWRWLTGNKENIAKISDAVGFKYQEKNGTFIHPGALIVISPTGKVMRYLFGLDFLPFHLKMSLAEAAQEKSGPTMAKILRFCFSFDPAGRTYVLNATRLVMVVTILILAFFILFLVKTSNRTNPGKKSSSPIEVR